MGVSQVLSLSQRLLSCILGAPAWHVHVLLLTREALQKEMDVTVSVSHSAGGQVRAIHPMTIALIDQGQQILACQVGAMRLLSDNSLVHLCSF